MLILPLTYQHNGRAVSFDVEAAEPQWTCLTLMHAMYHGARTVAKLPAPVACRVIVHQGADGRVELSIDHNGGRLFSPPLTLPADVLKEMHLAYRPYELGRAVAGADVRGVPES